MDPRVPREKSGVPRRMAKVTSFYPRMDKLTTFTNDNNADEGLTCLGIGQNQLV